MAVAALFAFGDRARQAGFKVLVLTVLPAGDGVGIVPADYTARTLAINDRLRSEWQDHFDAFADVAVHPALMDPMNTTTYDAEDRLHLTADGARAVAGPLGELAR
ncbi:hypothetical protein Pan44_50820 [Caulifigura coniformis]|uniref:SGNH hydrolase-type esterase domain-containing protein n=1 Tax=Caulifigura coniformis TaxID=2527983 RepID=A0A517SLL6_9PLAN|nr:hypothetical protein [Caulifigura coniformis]QDT57017.1 hypothetical protein Pan44_50820 [Caulifigura coniformis]